MASGSKHGSPPQKILARAGVIKGCPEGNPLWRGHGGVPQKNISGRVGGKYPICHSELPCHSELISESQYNETL